MRITDEFIADVSQRFGKNLRVRRSLPDGGLLLLDRRLPFLCVYRQHPDNEDIGTEDLIRGEASLLIASSKLMATKSFGRLVETIASVAAERFGTFLMLEIWAAPTQDVVEATDIQDVLPTEYQPHFCVVQGPRVGNHTVSSLVGNLKRIGYLNQKAEVELSTDTTQRRNAKPLLSAVAAKRTNARFIGIEIRPIYRDPKSGLTFPAIVRSLRRGIGRALRRAFHTFTRTETNISSKHYFALGPRAIVKTVWEVDRRLSELAKEFDFLLQVTPVNAEAAWGEFRRSNYSETPKFYYRPLTVDPVELKRKLYDIPIVRIDDPTIALLFREFQDELDRTITMLGDIGTSRFLHGSMQIYGGIDNQLLRNAMSLLASIAPKSREGSHGRQLKADEFAQLAQVEIDYYRKQFPAFQGRAIVRDDMYNGLMCSRGDLLIGHQAVVPQNRANALIQHEVGTHLLTYYNGQASQFHLLSSGFAGYDELQEGLAVLTEYLVGGLSRPRLRTLAGRVVAAKQIIDGASFPETWRMLTDQYGFPKRQAYTITMRIYRGGGLTKDAIYFRGLLHMLEYIQEGGQLEPLFVGKIAAKHIPLVEELRHRHVIGPPSLSPRYVGLPEVETRLQRIREGEDRYALLMEPNN